MVTDLLGTGQIRFVDKNAGQFRYHHLTIPLKKSYGIAMYHEELEPDGQGIDWCLYYFHKSCRSNYM